MAGKSAANTRTREQEQEERLAQLEAQQAPAPAAAAMAPPVSAPAPASSGGTDVVAELTKLKGLLDAGVLTTDEFEVAKQKVLAS